MSPARTGRIHLGETIVAELRDARLPLEPRQFAFWFAHKSGRNTALSAAANEIRARNGTLTGADIDRLYDIYLSPWRMAEQPDAVAARMAAKVAELAAALESTIEAEQEQREALASERNELGIATALTLHDVLGAIDRLTASTRESQTRFALLEARVDAVGREIGALQRQLAAVRADCAADPVTMLPNRAAFDRILVTALTKATETRQPLALILCDLDYFAAFNDNFGSFTADQVLRSIALLFRAQLRPGDAVARFEGDRFAALLPRLRASEAVSCAECFRQTLTTHELIPHPNGAGRITASLGVADATRGDTPELLLRRAQDALKIAKREGRNRVVEMTPGGAIWKAERRV